MGFLLESPVPTCSGLVDTAYGTLCLELALHKVPDPKCHHLTADLEALS